LAQETGIPSVLKELIGKESQPTTWEVEKGWIQRFAEAIDDPNPLWSDEKFARKTRYGGIIAPPTFPAALRNEEAMKMFFEIDIPQKRVLNGGNELEFFQPIRPGDRITVTAKLVDVREREGRMGKMLFLIQEVTYTNQFGEVVAVGRNTIIRY